MEAKKLLEMDDPVLPDLSIWTHVLDNEDYILERMQVCFEEAGITHYRMFSDSDMFIESITPEIDIAVIDYYLNEERTGLEVAKEVTARNPRCFVIMVTGQTDRKIILEGFNNKLINRYVEKGKDDSFIYEVEKFVKQGIQQVKDDRDYVLKCIKELAKKY